MAFSPSANHLPLAADEKNMETSIILRTPTWILPAICLDWRVHDICVELLEAQDTSAADRGSH
jgi:hypothetical protein